MSMNHLYKPTFCINYKILMLAERISKANAIQILRKVRQKLKLVEGQPVSYFHYCQYRGFDYTHFKSWAAEKKPQYTINAKEIASIESCSNITARRRVVEIKNSLGLQKHSPLSIYHYCQYRGFDYDRFIAEIMA